MRKTGVADLPLHSGKAPRWLFEKMVELSGEIISVLTFEYGKKEVTKRFSDPFWFQAFGCVVGFDWHSSGVTTTLLGAIKEAMRIRNYELGIFVAGGKGKSAINTPKEIDSICDKFGITKGEELIRVSRLTAKVDNNALQDGFKLYHHNLIFTDEGDWIVIQQGMDPEKRLARRYHWLGEKVKSFVDEPHSAICCDEKRRVFNLVARESKKLRDSMVEIVKEEKTEKIVAEVKLTLSLPKHHDVKLKDIDLRKLSAVIRNAKENLNSFEDLLLTNGMGEKALRALALTSSLIYGTEVSYRDPVIFSFAHGGKDGHPYPVNIRLIKNTIEILKEALNKAKLGDREKLERIRRLAEWERTLER